MSTFENKTALVTGGCGFIGSALVRLLLDEGARVIAVDNLATGKKENLPSVGEDTLVAQYLDVRDGEALRPLLREADVVYHLACLGVRHSIHSPHENNEVNATATLHLLALSREEKVGRFVHVSTSEVYGTAARVPMDEETPAFPHTVYGSSKLAGECHARAYAKTYGFPTVVLRPFNSYGPRCHHEGDSGEVIPKFMLRALTERPMLVFGDGEQTRDFTYVDDTARGILLAGLADKVLGHTVNLGSGKEITVNDLATLVAQVTERPNAIVERVEPRPGDVLRLFADSSAAESLLDFRPEVSLRNGLHRLLAWYRKGEATPEQLLEEDLALNWVSEKQ